MTRATTVTNRNIRLAKQRWAGLSKIALMALRELSREYRLSVALGDLLYIDERTVFKPGDCQGFVGYGDADPSNVSALVHGAEMRVAETRAVNRALRKAYGIGICSVEEIGSFAGQAASRPESKKLPQPENGNGYGGRTVRDRLCQLIRQHQLDATLVKSYATDFCGVKTLREATREQVENFVAHLADWAEKDRSALLCQLNSYLGAKEGAA